MLVLVLVGLGRGGLVVRVGMGMLRLMLSGGGDRVGMRDRRAGRLDFLDLSAAVGLLSLP